MKDESNTCPVCGCSYITRSSDWKRMCKCNSDPKMYDSLQDMFKELFKEKSEHAEKQN